MKLLILASILLYSVMPTSTEPENKPTWLIFLVTGDNPPKASDEEIQKYQMAHIDNFKRLFGEGKLLTAGPMKDQTKKKRGITIFCVKTKEEALAGFEPDPYVQKGFMKTEPISLKPQFGRINTKNIDPNGIVENRIAIFETASPSAKIDPSAESAYVKSTEPKVELAFFATAGESKTIRAIALFRGKDDATITSWLDNDPAIKSGALKYTLMPQWLAKGIL